MWLAVRSSRPKGTALITGASAGLGAAIAHELVKRNKVSGLVLTARRKDRLEALAQDLRALDPELEIVTIGADLADPVSPEVLITRTLERFGGLDILINNAGPGLPTLFADGKPELLLRQIAVNLTAPLMLTHRALPSLLERRGIIINIGSVITCVPNSVLGAYGATKSALAYWNDALRRELHAQGVDVCLVEPGPIITEFSEAMGRLLEEDERPHAATGIPSAWMMATAEEVAHRVVRLIDKPKRRVSVRRRIVWPLRMIGSLFRLWPSLGDLAVTRVLDAARTVTLATISTQETQSALNAEGTNDSCLSVVGAVINESGDHP
jgi:short-subunit dehydrogenase